jgi:LacI family repressor for deo operon, udp, cdd, tsx, nupC, and nupG
LNNRNHISIPESTRQRVREVAEQMGYRPNLLARNLNQGRTHTIGVVAPRMDNTFCGRILQGIQEEFMAADYRVLLAQTLNKPEVEARQVALLLDHQVEGIITVTDDGTLHELPQRIETILHRGVPCIVVDDKSLAGTVDCLVSDDLHGAELATAHLVKLGHRRIAHLSGGVIASSGRDRVAGYQKALHAAGIPLDPNLVVGHSFQKNEGAPAMNQLLDRPKPPTAVFAANDELAAEAMQVIRQRGLRLPEDIALVGYANFEVSQYLGLTTVEQDALEMGRCAARRLLLRMKNLKLPPELLLTPTKLIIRETSGKARPMSARKRSH